MTKRAGPTITSVHFSHASPVSHRSSRDPAHSGTRSPSSLALGPMLDGDRKREAAHPALLDRQGTLIDEVACALHDAQASGTTQD
jgi:hypothetical protein